MEEIQKSNDFAGKVAIISGGGSQELVPQQQNCLHLAFNNAGIVGPEKHVGEFLQLRNVIKDRGDKASLFNDKPIAGSLTLTSVKIEQA